MLPPICYTCGDILSNIQIPYQRDIHELCEKYNIDIDVLSMGVLNNDEFNKEKELIVDKYCDKHRYCHRMRLTNFSPLVNVVGS